MVSQEEFTITRCGNCNLLYTNPRPGEGEGQAYYLSEDYISHTGNRRNLMEKIYHLVRREMLSRKKKLLNYLLPGKKRVLDIGCGTGEFLKHIQDSDNEVIGYEPMATARQKAIENGIHVLAYEHQLDETPKVDVITLWHVLEHIPDFDKKLLKYHQLLNDRGVLILALPQWKSFDASFYQKYWAAWDVPRHLYHFDQQVLQAACKKAGFTLKQINALPFDAYFISLLSEKYKKNRLGFLRAMIIGTLSGLLAMSGRRPWSSQIFVFGKNHFQE